LTQYNSRRMLGRTRGQDSRQELQNKVALFAEKNLLANRYKDPDLSDESPDYRWKECLRMIGLPVYDREPPIGAYDIPMRYLELLTRGIYIRQKERPPIFSDFALAHELSTDTDAKSMKWKLEALLCAQLSQQEIALEIRVPFKVIQMYEYYFFDLREKETVDILAYIQTDCTIQPHDATLKYVAAVGGIRMYHFFNGQFTSIQSEEDLAQIKNLLTSGSIYSMFAKTVGRGTNMELQNSLRIFEMGLKEAMVTYRIESDTPASKGGTGVNNDPSEAYYLANSDRIRNVMTDIESKKALETGGRAASDHVKKAKQTHFEAAIEATTAPEDFMSDEERDGLGFHV
jgi:hypothetical protein